MQAVNVAGGVADDRVNGGGVDCKDVSQRYNRKWSKSRFHWDLYLNIAESRCVQRKGEAGTI